MTKVTSKDGTQIAYETHAQHRTLEGQTHDVKPEVILPVLVEFFKN